MDNPETQSKLGIIHRTKTKKITQQYRKLKRWTTRIYSINSANVTSALLFFFIAFHANFEDFILLLNMDSTYFTQLIEKC
jgi:hypothetical protein